MNSAQETVSTLLPQPKCCWRTATAPGGRPSQQSDQRKRELRRRYAVRYAGTKAYNSSSKGIAALSRIQYRQICVGAMFWAIMSLVCVQGWYVCRLS
eukprot:983491-Pelagomonas_calceolata.AAC.2